MMFLKFSLASVSVLKDNSLLFVLSALLLVHRSFGLRLTKMNVPPIADIRGKMNLDCHFDMGNEELYAVKWYKDDHEFFRYLPYQQPHMMIFPVQGVEIVQQETDCSVRRCKVMLKNLTRELSGGAYRCEVSSEAPAFRLASETHNITVAALPKENPIIDNVEDYYEVGQHLRARCISPAANPTPSLSWFINDQQANSSYVIDGSSTLPDQEGLTTRSIWLRFTVDSNDAPGNKIQLKCESRLPDVPVDPQTVYKTILVRPGKQHGTQVNNQQRYLSHDYGGAPSLTLLHRWIIFAMMLPLI